MKSVLRRSILRMLASIFETKEIKVFAKCMISRGLRMLLGIAISMASIVKMKVVQWSRVRIS